MSGTAGIRGARSVLRRVDGRPRDPALSVPLTVADASGRAQAEHLLEVVPDDEDALPPAVDLELAGNCAARPLSTRVHRELDEFLTALESTTGQRVVLYVGDDFENAYPVRNALDHPLWHRRIFWRADVDGWWIWQFTGWGRVDGIRGRVDVNVMREGS